MNQASEQCDGNDGAQNGVCISAGESGQGRGLLNHFNPLLKLNSSSVYEGDMENVGMVKRQKYFGKMQINGKQLVLNNSVLPYRHYQILFDMKKPPIIVHCLNLYKP